MPTLSTSPGTASESRGSDGRIDRWVRPGIRQLSAYHVPEAEGFVKLDAMENPYSWPEAIITEWLKRIRHAELNRYPDAEAHRLKARLREFLGMPPDLGLVLGNGSDELIQMIALTITGPGRTLLTAEPSFAMYRIIAAIAGLDYVGVPLQGEDFGLDPDAMLSAIERYEPALLVLSYPNNPTGNLFDAAVIHRLIEASPGLVLVDEAYFDFAGATFLTELGRYGQVLVLRTLSKLGLAGLRVGMLVGSEAWLQETGKLRLPYNINVLSQVSGEFMLTHAGVLREQVGRICRDRDELYRELMTLDGLEVWPSRTNFLLTRVPGRAAHVFEGLKDRKILIKSLDGAHPLLKDCLRVTVGTPLENGMFVEALKELLV